MRLFTLFSCLLGLVLCGGPGIPSAPASGPERVFLEEIESWFERYGNKPVPLHYPDERTDPERQKIIRAYKWSLPKLWIGLEAMCYAFLDMEGPFPHRPAIERYLKRSRPITPRDLLDCFKPKILKGEFTLKNGDIAMVLPHALESYKIAVLLDTAFEHWDLVWIDENDRPRVFLIHPDGIENITLVEFLLGYYNHNDAFAIYRSREAFDEKKMDAVLTRIRDRFENVYYDEAFYRDTRIASLERFLETPRFFYCGELIFSVYQYVLGREDFSSNHYTPLRQMFINKKIRISPLNAFFLRYAETMENEERRWIIDPKNFYLSDNFEPVIVFGPDVSVNDRFASGDALAAQTRKGPPRGGP